MKLFKDLWSYISQAGISEEMDSRLMRKVVLTNQIAFIACCTTFIQMFMFPTISMFPLLCASAIACYMLTYWFNTRKWYDLSRLYFCIVSCLVLVVTGGLISESVNISFRLVLIQAFVLPMVVFDIREPKLQWSGFLCFVLFYILFDPINEAIPMMEGVDITLFDSPQNIVVNGVLCMVTLLLGNRYLQKLNLKAENELQKTIETSIKQREVIEKKNEFIQEGITYAQQIQHAVLPKQEDMFVCLPDHFVFYKPKNIIGGDFYWYGEYEDHILIAAVDCTGQGAAGALISIVGSQMLDRIVKDKGITDPAEVLEILNLEIIQTLHRDNALMKDGMDISLLSLDVKNRKVKFAGAKNNLVIINNDSIKQLRGDRISIGESHSLEEGFKCQTVPLKNNDSLYLFTDGIIDQFGGPKNKKMLRKRLFSALKKNAEYSMDIQADCIKRVSEQWQGAHSQTDDILLLGLRINFEHISQVRSFQGQSNSPDAFLAAS